MQITEKKFMELTRELHTVKNALEESLVEQAAAAAAGDLRENEEYETSRANSERLSNRKRELENLLSDADVVQNDNTPRISLGSTVDVTKVNADGTPLSETRRFVLESEGDTVLKRTLGVESPLGKEILNGTNGIYFVHNNGGIYYHVAKVLTV